MIDGFGIFDSSTSLLDIVSNWKGLCKKPVTSISGPICSNTTFSNPAEKRTSTIQWIVPIQHWCELAKVQFLLSYLTLNDLRVASD
jgi:hypothetical protein